MSLSMSQQLFYSTFRIDSYCNGQQIGSGTGFHFCFNSDDNAEVPLLITNKHVVEGADRIVLPVHVKEGEKPSGEVVRAEIEIHDDLVIYHPDPDIDLCGINFAHIKNDMHAAGKFPFIINAGFDIIPRDEDWEHFDAVEDIMMVGCPNGLWDSFNSLPLARRGISATPISMNYEGKEQFVVDMACFPGSSGSPIFIFNERGYLDRKSNVYLIDGKRILLVGILYAGPQISSSGQVVLARPTEFQFNSMMHLGYAIRSNAIFGIHAEVLKRISANAQPPL